MVRDDAMAEGGVAGAGHATGRFRGRDQVAEQVDVIIVGLALQNGGDALQPHAGVDRRLGQIKAGVLVHLLELHEDQIPEFQEAIAVFIRAAGRAARHAGALVVEDFRAIAARAGRAHRPQIGFMADDAVVGETGDFLPELTRLVVGGIDRDQQLVLGQAHDLGREVPGEQDRFFLEVIAEGEVAQHLEKGVVAGGVTDIVQVVMLAAGAHAFLHGGGAAVGTLFGAREQVLELDHARIGEQQGRVVARHQRRGREHGVPTLGEEIEKTAADVGKAFHGKGL